MTLIEALQEALGGRPVSCNTPRKKTVVYRESVVNSLMLYEVIHNCNDDFGELVIFTDDEINADWSYDDDEKI